MAVQYQEFTSGQVTVTSANSIVNGGIIYLENTNGIQVIMPPATGSGNLYEFVVKTLLTSPGTYYWNTADIFSTGLDTFNGQATNQPTNLGLPQAFFSPVGCNIIAFDGAGKGGQFGDRVRLIDTKTNYWQVSVTAEALSPAVPTTPFEIFVPAPAVPQQPAQTNPVVNATKNLTAAAYTLDQSYDTNNTAVNFLQNQAGIIITLPPSTGSSNVYNFVVSQVPNNSAYIFQPANQNTESFGGAALIERGTGDQSYFGPSLVANAFEFDGQLRGGQIGDCVRFVDNFQGIWKVYAIGMALPTVNLPKNPFLKIKTAP